MCARSVWHGKWATRIAKWTSACVRARGAAKSLSFPNAHKWNLGLRERAWKSFPSLAYIHRKFHSTRLRCNEPTVKTFSFIWLFFSSSFFFSSFAFENSFRNFAADVNVISFTKEPIAVHWWIFFFNRDVDRKLNVTVIGLMIYSMYYLMYYRASIALKSNVILLSVITKRIFVFFFFC